MLVFSTQLCELMPIYSYPWFHSPPFPLWISIPSNVLSSTYFLGKTFFFSKSFLGDPPLIFLEVCLKFRSMESLSRAVETHMESILAIMGAFGTIGSHPDEDYSMRRSQEWAYMAPMWTYIAPWRASAAPGLSCTCEDALVLMLMLMLESRRPTLSHEGSHWSHGGSPWGHVGSPWRAPQWVILIWMAPNGSKGSHLS